MIRCLTPGAVFHINISPRGLSVAVDASLSVSAEEAQRIEDQIHDAVEPIVARCMEAA